MSRIANPFSCAPNVRLRADHPGYPGVNNARRQFHRWESSIIARMIRDDLRSDLLRASNTVRFTVARGCRHHDFISMKDFGRDCISRRGKRREIISCALAHAYTR